MEAQLAEFRNKGMMQDASISKSSNEFAFKNVNIRITAVNDNTLFSVTNEKGSEGIDIKKTEVAIPNKITFVEEAHIGQDISWKAVSQYPVASDIEIEFDHHETLETYYFYINEGESESNVIEAWDTDYPSYQNTQIDITEDDSYTYYVDGDDVPEERKVIVDQTIEGAYIGKCIIGNYLILFTKETGYDRIYRCSILDNGNLLADCIVERDLGFVGPVETVGYFEREDIQKVYWVDGENPNRVINIMLDADKQPDIFDFNPEVGDIPTISVQKQYVGVGSFPAGTIQYFVSYYNSLGQETRIANASSLYYITRENGGGAPGDTMTCSFNISLSGLNTSFQYVRVYSAIRATLDGPIDARIVGDYAIPQSGSISVVDTGRNEEAIDSSVLYYVGGDKFIASTIEDKDNVLFFGDIKLNNIVLSDEDIQRIKLDFTSGLFSFVSVDIRNVGNLNKHFKYGNIYKFAIQFINDSNEMTGAIDICSMQCEYPPICTGAITQLQESTTYLPKLKFEWPHSLSHCSEIISRFSRYRILVAETSEATRSVIAQGIINPTVFRLGDREDETIYAIPSWITRPQNTPNSRHLEIIGGHWYRPDNPESSNSYFGTGNRQITAFVACKNCEFSSLQNTAPPTEAYLNEIDRNSYYVDESVVTLNSPEIQYGNISSESLKFRIVGFAKVSTKYNDYQLQYTQPTSNAITLGMVYSRQSMAPGYETVRDSNNHILWRTYSWNQYADGADVVFQDDTAKSVISIWQNAGYLGKSSNSTKNILKSKIFSTYKECPYTAYFSLNNGPSYIDYDADPSNEKTTIAIFKSGETLFKLGDKYISGDYDNLITPQSNYSTYYAAHEKQWWNKSVYPPLSASSSRLDTTRIRVKYSNFAAIDLRPEQWGYDEILPKFESSINFMCAPWSISSVYNRTFDTTESRNILWTYGNTSSIQQREASSYVFSISPTGGFQSTEISEHQSLYEDKLIYTPICAGEEKYQTTIYYNTKFLFIGELYRNIPGDTIEEKATALYGSSENIKWLPCGVIKNIGQDTNGNETNGDTFFQRYECLRAYPYAEEDANSVVDIVSFMVETYQNLDERYGTNRGYENMNNARPQNYGLINTAYNQANNIFKYNTIEERLQYDKFPQQFAWSLNKSAVSEVDAWTSATLSNIYNVDGSYGPINAIEKLNDTLVAFQDRAIFVINFNNRTQISTEQGLPIELANSGKVDGITYLTRHYGCKNKYSIVSTKTGLYFIDDENRAFVNISKDGIADITASSGMSVWFEKQTSYNKKWAGGDIADYGAFVVGYDSNRGDIYIMNGANSDAGCLVYNETLKTFTSFFDVHSTGYKFPLMYNFNGETYGLNGAGNLFNKLFGGTYGSNYSVEYRVNPEPLTDKIFTNIDYIADVYDYGVDEDVESTTLRPMDGTLHPIASVQPFDMLHVFTEYQRESKQLTANSWQDITDNATMFRIRHAEIPSTGKYGLDRIRNPWVHIKLSAETNVPDKLMQFHSLTVKYFK